MILLIQSCMNKVNVSSSVFLSFNRNDLLCSVKYRNTLPDIPFDPKFLSYPFEPQRFVKNVEK